MTDPKHNLQREYRCTVTTQNDQSTFTLPAPLVPEVGFDSAPWETEKSANVAWYYHEEQNKAVLGTKELDRSSLELQGASSLSGVSNGDLEAADVVSARVTIIEDLPQSLYKRLTSADQLVLKPIVSTEHSALSYTSISVYPAEEYDSGTLSNVTRTKISTTDSDENEEDTPDEVGEYGGFTDLAGI